MSAGISQTRKQQNYLVGDVVLIHLQAAGSPFVSADASTVFLTDRCHVTGPLDVSGKGLTRPMWGQEAFVLF